MYIIKTPFLCSALVYTVPESKLDDELKELRERVNKLTKELAEHDKVLL